MSTAISVSECENGSPRADFSTAEESTTETEDRGAL
jgi:hypothetical protein